MITRRQAIKSTAIVASTIAAAPTLLAQSQVSASATATAKVVSPSFTLPPLPYAFDALEPYIDARTMEIHHDRHHQGYVNNLNKAVADYPTMAKETVEVLLMNLNTAVPEAIRTAVRNNGGGHANHSLFWQTMKKNGGGEPGGELARAIDASFGNFNNFKEGFTKAAMSRFGSGWAWLTLQAGKLAVESSANQDSPITSGKHPLLGLDVWEHAYYLKYQNKRADYVAAWWNVVNWDFVAERYAKLKA